MIEPHGYIIAMNEHDEPCLELNEIIYRITGEFWSQAYYGLLVKQRLYEPDSQISIHKAVSELRKGIKNLAKQNGLKYSGFSHKEQFYISLIPYPIYIGIDQNSGDFSISTPHISTHHFTHSNWMAGLNWIQDYINIDIKPLTEKIEAVREKFYLNTKTSKIAKVSIKALCDSILGRKLLPYKTYQTRLRSEILFLTPEKAIYEIEIYHKPFSKDVSLLIDLLNNPREMQIPDTVNCAVIHCCEDEINSMVENLRNMQEAVV